MRDQSCYVRTLSNWSQELQVCLLVIHLKFQSRKNHWVLIKGADKQVKTFKKYLRTRNVDVDSKGKPCRERLATELFIKTLDECQDLCMTKVMTSKETTVDDEKALHSLFGHLGLSSEMPKLSYPD